MQQNQYEKIIVEIKNNKEKLFNLNYEKSLKTYLFIKDAFEKGDVTRNEDFKRVYMGFYRLTMAGLPPEWKERHFELLGERKKEFKRDFRRTLFDSKLPKKKYRTV